MGNIQWDDSMSIGIDEIDEQHKNGSIFITTCTIAYWA